MLYIFWGVLNFGFFLLFIFLLVRATRLIRGKLGNLAALVFVIGLFGYIIFFNQKQFKSKDKPIQARKWKFSADSSIDSNTINIIDLRVEENKFNAVLLSVNYGKSSKDGTPIPQSAISGLTGYVSGLNWAPTNISVNTTADKNKFEYRLTGQMEFKLLGVVVFTKSKLFQGIVAVK